MISVPLNARVYCQDGPGGIVTGVVIDPRVGKVTHFIVRVKSSPGDIQVSVPLDGVLDTSSDEVYLSYTMAELVSMDPFIKKQFIETGFTAYDNPSYYSPQVFTPADTGYLAVEEERIPAGELSIHRGAAVEAQDGYVGEVGEFLIEPARGDITHLILKSGHMWGKKAVALPVSAVQRIEHDTVYLKISKQAVGKLPAIPVRRTWEEVSVEDVELLIAVFADERTGQHVLNEMRKLDRYDDLDILNAALAVKAEDGKTHIYETGDVYPRRGALFGALAGGLFGLLGGPVGMVIGALAGAFTGHTVAGKIDMGFSDSYLEELKQSLEPGTSAVVALVENKWVATLVETLSQHDAKIFRHTIPDEAVARILALIEADRDGDSK